MELHPDIERVALLGWRVYPASRTSKAARFKGATDAATYDLDQLAAWSNDYPNSNWRVVMQGSGVWGLDIDAPGQDHAADGLAAMARMVKKHGALPPGPRTRSGGGGVALFFRHDGELIYGKTGYPVPGIDPRRGKLSITIPPSIHLTTKRPYVWLTAPWDIAPPAAPDWLLQAVKPPPAPPMPKIRTAPSRIGARVILDRAVGRVISACAGERNATLNRQGYIVARFVGAYLLDEAEAMDTLYSAGRRIGLHHLEIRDTLKSAFRSGFHNPVSK